MPMVRVRVMVMVRVMVRLRVRLRVVRTRDEVAATSQPACLWLRSG